MINIAICDDEDKTLEKYKELFSQIHEEYEVKISCEYFHSAEELLENEICVSKMDILYIDNYMAELEGIEAAEMIREVNKEVQIIFCSTSSDFIFDAFRVKANNYILKGKMSDMEFKINFMSVYEEVMSYKNNLFVCQQSNSQILIPVNDVMAVEIISRKMYVYTLENTFSCYGSINEIYQKYKDDGFVMATRSCMVNLYYIKKVGKNDIVLTDDRTFEITSKRVKEVKKELIKYYESI